MDPITVDVQFVTRRRPNAGVAIMLSAATSDGEPAKEIRLFKFGKNETTKGVFTLTKDGAAGILEKFAAYGNDLAIDYEHQTFEAASNGPVPAAGWIRQGGLEVREDGLWAKVEWTARATELIKAKEYRYFSPTFLHTKTGEIVELAPIALVNYPATMDMDPLIAASAVDRRSRRVELMSFSDMTSALWKAIQARFGWDACVCDVFDEEVVYMAGDRMWRCGYAMDGSRAVLTGEPEEVERAYAPVIQASARSGQAAPMTPSPETDPMKLVTAKLGLVEGANETAILAAVEPALAVRDDVMRLTGQTTRDEALGVLAAWKSAHEKVAQLQAEVAAANKRAEDTERAELVAKLRAEKKITPAQIEAFAGESLAFLKKFAASAPVIPQLAAAPAQEPKGSVGEPMKHNGKTYAELSFVEKHNLHATEPDLFRALKNDHLARNPVA
jgi:phage I-like protein